MAGRSFVVALLVYVYLISLPNVSFCNSGDNVVAESLPLGNDTQYGSGSGSSHHHSFPLKDDSYASSYSDCPPWFRKSSNSSTCFCADTLRTTIRCNDETKESFIAINYCMSYNDNTTEVVVGPCPPYPYIPDGGVSHTHAHRKHTHTVHRTNTQTGRQLIT